MARSLPEGVTIEEGGYYVRRDGEVVGPAKYAPDHAADPMPWYINDTWYRPDGGYFHDDMLHNYDLVEEALRPATPAEIVANRAKYPDGGPLLPTDSAERKNTPVYSGVMAYFPRALAYIAQVSKAGNDKHNPGQPLHWSKDKSNDHADCVARHLIEHGTVDPDDNLRHSGKLAWRALALLETELENSAQGGAVSA